MGDPMGDGKAKSGAAIFARGCRVGLLEGLEQAGYLFRGNADTGVLRLETNQKATVLPIVKTKISPD
jgi:hypothetical protein